jgi:type IV secretion system protein VirB3
MSAEDDELYLAPCRPAMIWSVPLQGWLACISSLMLPLILWGLPAVIPAGAFSAALYFLMRECFARDFNCVNVLRAWFVTRAGAPGALTWGGASFDPLPRPPRSVSEALRRA